MTSNAGISVIDGAGNSGTIIEIKIKTMDSQTHTLRVDKQVPVPTLKEQIATVTGIVREHQRLICRGRVLKDDQLLSAYHVEDGHTLHLVVREPPSASAMENLPSDAAFGLPSGGPSEYFQVAPGVVVEAFNMHGQGERNLPDISRIVSAVLGSIGLAGAGSFGEGTSLGEIEIENLGRIPVRGVSTDLNQPHPEQPGSRIPSDRSRPRNPFGVGAAFPFGVGQAPVIPDALSTLSQYLINMQREFSGNGETDAWPTTGMNTEQTEAGSVPSGLPTPASLAELLFSTRELLHQQSGDCLVQLARQLESQASVTDPDARLSTQSSAWRTGVLFQNLGAYLLELGRTIMTLRLGRSPAEAIVNAGPAVFISSSGPNPLMVQPLPFQPGASFGSAPTGTVPAGPSLSNGLGSGLLPRRIDIHIRRGSLSRQPEGDGTQQSPGQQDPSAGLNSESVTNEPTSAAPNNPSLPGGPSVRVVPLRSMMAAIPAIPDLNRVPSSDLSGGFSGMQLPFFGRYVNARNISSSRTGSQLPSENQPSDLQTQQTVIPEVASQQQNAENPPRNDVTGQGDRPPTRTIDISIFSSGSVQGDQNPDGQPPDSVLQFLRGLFPGGEVHVESSQGAASVSFPERESTTRAGEAAVAAAAAAAAAAGAAVPVAESSIAWPTQDGIFLSGLLHQIMPLISQLPHTDQNDAAMTGGAGPSSSTTVEDPEAGNSRRQTDSKDEPNSKRQKME